MTVFLLNANYGSGVTFMLEIQWAVNGTILVSLHSNRLNLQSFSDALPEK
jgi:hypothetical protein